MSVQVTYTDAEYEATERVLKAVDAAVFHDHTDTGTCPDCADDDGLCPRANTLWTEVYAAAKALRSLQGSEATPEGGAG